MPNQIPARNRTLNDPPGIERLVPGETGGTVYSEHMGRYEFASRFVKNLRVLDVACGAGYGAPVLCAAGARSYLGLDISDEALRIAERRYRTSENIKFSRADACSLPELARGSFDMVVSFETIEHLRDPERFLARIKDVLAPSGILIISTPNRSVYDPTGGRGRRPTNPFHIQEWTAREFVLLLRRSFSVDSVLGQGLCPQWKVVGRRLAARHPILRRAVDAYRPTRPIATPTQAAYKSPVPVVPLRSLRPPTYVICLCRPRRGGKDNAAPPPTPTRVPHRGPVDSDHP